MNIIKNNMPLVRSILFMGLALSIFPISYAAATDMSRQAIIERIKPVGQVFIEKEQPTAEPKKKSAKEAQQPVVKKISGEVIYKNHCAICHNIGAAGAPKLAVKVDWEGRTTKDVDNLVKHVIKGYKIMPPKGACMKCSDKELRAAVEYMVSKVK